MVTTRPPFCRKSSRMMTTIMCDMTMSTSSVVLVAHQTNNINSKASPNPRPSPALTGLTWPLLHNMAGTTSLVAFLLDIPINQHFQPTVPTTTKPTQHQRPRSRHARTGFSLPLSPKCRQIITEKHLAVPPPPGAIAVRAVKTTSLRHQLHWWLERYHGPSAAQGPEMWTHTRISHRPHLSDRQTILPALQRQQKPRHSLGMSLEGWPPPEPPPGAWTSCYYELLSVSPRHLDLLMGCVQRDHSSQRTRPDCYPAITSFDLYERKRSLTLLQMLRRHLVSTPRTQPHLLWNR